MARLRVHLTNIGVAHISGVLTSTWAGRIPSVSRSVKEDPQVHNSTRYGPRYALGAGYIPSPSIWNYRRLNWFRSEYVYLCDLD